VHPFEGSVTVTVYDPAALTVAEAVLAPETIPGPLQLNIAPVVVDEAFKTTDVAEQVSVCEEPAFAFGADVFELTVTVDGAVHPFDGSVIVNV
jgi:hypothetical protein